MSKYGLALSGGGFRAALYHLGVIRFLRDAGALEQVTNIASVSGGSVLAAHLVLNWERYKGDDGSFDASENNYFFPSGSDFFFSSVSSGSAPLRSKAPNISGSSPLRSNKPFSAMLPICGPLSVIVTHMM